MSDGRRAPDAVGAGGHIEGHRSTGTSESWWNWEFAEGGAGFFTTYVAVFNTEPSQATMRFYYRHENGSLYSQDVGLSAHGRAVVGTPPWVPSGGFGVLITSDKRIAAERMVYAGPTWTIGPASPGARQGAAFWYFAEGTAAGMLDTYFLIANRRTGGRA